MSMNENPRGSPVAILLDPRTDIPIGERDIRLGDYLNDKVQSRADLSNLTTLLENVEVQKQQLEEQLDDARMKLAEARKASADHTSSLARQTEEFEKQQESLRERLTIVTSSNTPEEAVRRLQGPMEKLRQVELAQAYVELLKEVNRMTKDARSHLPHDPKAALEPYVRLRQLAIALRAAQEPAEGAAVHLVSYVEQTSTQLWAQMVQILTKEFRDILATLKWPNTEIEPTREWSDCFTRLLELQAPEIKDAQGPLILLPFSVMVEPLEREFRYHFMGNKSTAAASHLGELFFSWFIATVTEHESYLRDNVGPVLAAHFMGNALAGNSLYVDPVSAFITALLPVVREKINAVLSDISNEPLSVSKFISELIVWDETVRTKFLYDGGNAEVGWKGLTWDILDVWFNRWMDIEQSFVVKRYEEIIQASDSGLIDYDSNEDRKTKATFGATKITDLLKNITTLYQGLKRFSHKLRFFLHGQINVLDRYQLRLGDALEAYMSLTSSVIGTFQTYTREERMSVEGMAGIVSLSKVFCSADHIVTTLREMTNEDFFVELYDELEARAKVTHPESGIAGPETLSTVKMSTSLKLGTGEGSMLDTSINSFKAIRDRAENLLQQAIKYSLPSALKSYLTKAQWATVGDEPLAMALSSNITISPELDQPLQTLQEDMAYLYKTISYTSFMRIWRQAISTLEDLLWGEVLLKQDFTTLGAARFAQDLRGIQNVFGMYFDMGTESSFTMMRLAQGIRLLNMPVKAEEGEMSLLEAAEKIFASREDCEAVLRTLGLDLLGNTHARQIMQRRVEASD